MLLLHPPRNDDRGFRCESVGDHILRGVEIVRVGSLLFIWGGLSPAGKLKLEVYRKSYGEAPTRASSAKNMPKRRRYWERGWGLQWIFRAIAEVIHKLSTS